ncbi:hypothetical protein CUMW_002810 [Citrus unshiu]|nr:hypothetical protein CUMW_002810 [Citrus unshiu]
MVIRDCACAGAKRTLPPTSKNEYEMPSELIMQIQRTYRSSSGLANNRKGNGWAPQTAGLGPSYAWRVCAVVGGRIRIGVPISTLPMNAEQKLMHLRRRWELRHGTSGKDKKGL